MLIMKIILFNNKMVLVLNNDSVDTYMIIPSSYTDTVCVATTVDIKEKIIVCNEGLEYFEFNIPKDEVEIPPYTVKEYISAGFAYGSYMCKCSECGEDFMGDKRATTCRPCAEKNIERCANTLPASPASEHEMALKFLTDFCTKVNPITCAHRHGGEFDKERLDELSNFQIDVEDFLTKNIRPTESKTAMLWQMMGIPKGDFCRGCGADFELNGKQVCFIFDRKKQKEEDKKEHAFRKLNICKKWWGEK